MLCLLTGMAWLYVQPVQAQKKEIAAAKDLVKAGKNLDQAQHNMEKLLLDSANRTNRKIWAVLYDAGGYRTCEKHGCNRKENRSAHGNADRRNPQKNG